MFVRRRQAVRTHDGRGATFLEAQRRRTRLLKPARVAHTRVTVPVAEKIEDSPSRRFAEHFQTLGELRVGWGTDPHRDPQPL